MVGTVIFLAIRLANNLFDWENPPSRDFWLENDLFYGAIFLLVGIVGLIDYDEIRSLPIIFILFTAFLLISRGFVEPNRNFLILILICGGTYFGFFYPFYMIFTAPPLIYDFSYGGFVAAGLSLGISLAVGIILNILFKRKWPEGQKKLWEATKFWEIINNKILISLIIVLIVIETTFQLRSQSLLLLFFKF